MQQLRSQATPIGNNANDKTSQNAITGRFLKEVSFYLIFNISYKVIQILMLIHKIVFLSIILLCNEIPSDGGRKKLRNFCMTRVLNLFI